MGVEPAEDGGQLFAVGRGDQVDLADQDDVGKLHLFDQQLGDRAFVVLAKGFAVAGQALGLVEVTQEVHPVDHRDHGVQASQIGQTLALFIAEGEGLGHRQRFGNTGGLDQQVVEAALASELADFFEQVFAQGAADAAIAHLHQLLFGAIEADAALHLVAVDVDLAHVVDDHSHAAAVAVLQDVVEQGALAGAEEAGQDGYREAVHGGLSGGTLVFFALFLALLRLDGQRRGGTQQQALQPDGFTGFGAPAVLAAGDGVQRGVDLVEQLFLPLQHAQLPVTLFFGAADVGGVAARLLFAQRLEFFLDTRLQLGTLVQKQVAEEGLLLCVHVRLGGLGE